MPQRTLNADQRLLEHLEDALVEADALGQTVVAALRSEEHTSELQSQR